jgi:hypothetical protein
MPALLRLLCAVAAAASLAGSSVAQTRPPVDLALVMAVDVSGSIDAGERSIQRDGYVAALVHDDFLRAVRAGREGRIAALYFEWSGRVFASSITPWTVVDGPEGARTLAAAIAGLPVHSAHGTSIARALDVAVGLMAAQPSPAARRVIDVSGDGPNNTGPALGDARARAIAAGVTINGLPLTLRPSDSVADVAEYYRDCVIGGDNAFLVAARGPSDVADAIHRKLILEISGLAPTVRVWPAGVVGPCEAEDSLGGARPPYFPGLRD